MAGKNEREVMEQLFEEMNSGVIKDYDEMQKRKSELLKVPPSKMVQKGHENVISGVLLKLILIVALVIGIVIITKSLGLRRAINQINYNGLSAYNDPLQTDVSIGDFTAQYGGKDWEISPKADYRLVAKVKSVHHISSRQDVAAEIGKYDLALAWGKLVDSQYDKYITYSQSGRSYSYIGSLDCPLSDQYISEHSANNHIIASNDSILKGVEGIKTNDIIYMEGYLVNISREEEKEKYEWNTSLSRNDNSYNSGCEVFYVKRLQIGSEIYE